MDNKTMDVSINVNLTPKFLETAATPLAREAGEALGDLINLARSPLIKARAKRDIEMKVFLENLEKELRKIPEGKIQEPPLAIVGPALENLFKYYMEEKHIVEAYQKIIAGAMNKDTAPCVHPIMTHIVSQMTQQDAVAFDQIGKQGFALSFSIGYVDVQPDSDLIFGDCGYCRMVLWPSDLKDKNRFKNPREFEGYQELKDLEHIGLVKSIPLSAYETDDRDYLHITWDDAKNKAVEALDLFQLNNPKTSFVLTGDGIKCWCLDSFGYSLAKILGRNV